MSLFEQRSVKRKSYSEESDKWQWTAQIFNGDRISLLNRVEMNLKWHLPGYRIFICVKQEDKWWINLICTIYANSVKPFKIRVEPREEMRESQSPLTHFACHLLVKSFNHLTYRTLYRLGSRNANILHIIYMLIFKLA